ncbi:class I SAM-dependent DNA methyltransferase [Phenylobacterium sp. NIBR 498073]|uniref:class I SAM-dependent DNA methyltransferase n=1 Tax=Phenylobacterium sp. NIBR 498073 TaxID=3015177 RepID=UPI0022B38122|nr:class I SAM-dependent DNA methyltransferase [Phenylobacterium sp. NIBR 498073]WGU40937.1 class I SAM-dependent DNA methyltransferase [Phenylobacterium sp. NIBR 498073]
MEEQFLDALRALGGSAGNGRLREALGWDGAAYDGVRATLIEKGLVKPGRGRGGSVALADGEGSTDGGAGEKAAAPKRAPREKAAKSANGGDLGFEGELFKAADKLRGNLEPSEYKHVALGLIFLKYISEAFEAQYERLQAEEFADPEDPEEYLAANVFWVPQEARWANLQANAKRPEIEFFDVVTKQTKKGDIGGLIDNAMEAIEQANVAVLKDVLPKTYARPQLDKTMLGELIDLFSNIDLMHKHGEAKDLLGRAYEYFISQFAGAEGKRGGEFFTPRSVVRTIVAMLEPTKGRVYDPCCGSGGMFVQSEAFVEEHQGKRSDIAIYGQERNHTTWRLCKMNLAVRGIDADIKWNNEGSFIRDEFPQLKFDYVMANPPFNISDWWQGSLDGDARWAFGTPPQGNANFAWLQHILHHLAPRGTAGVVLANGSMSSQQSGEGDIRKAMVEADVVDCMVALPGQLFYSTQIPACLWFLARDKSANGHRNRGGEILFIDARKMGHLVDRTRRELSEADIQTIADTYHRWRGNPETVAALGLEPYADQPGFSRSASLDEVRSHAHVLTPGRYVGTTNEEEDGISFQETFGRLRTKLEAQFAEARALEARIETALGRLN